MTHLLYLLRRWVSSKIIILKVYRCNFCQYGHILTPNMILFSKQLTKHCFNTVKIASLFNCYSFICYTMCAHMHNIQKVFCGVSTGTATLRIMTIGILKLNIMALNITTFSYAITLSITTITKYSQYNNK
jgi:hypothetical protein